MYYFYQNDIIKVEEILYFFGRKIFMSKRNKSIITLMILVIVILVIQMIHYTCMAVSYNKKMTKAEGRIDIVENRLDNIEIRVDKIEKEV